MVTSQFLGFDLAEGFLLFLHDFQDFLVFLSHRRRKDKLPRVVQEARREAIVNSLSICLFKCRNPFGEPGNCKTVFSQVSDFWLPEDVGIKFVKDMSR